MPKLALAFDVLANDRGATRTLDNVASHSEKTGKRIGKSFAALGGTIVGAFAGVASIHAFAGFIADAEESRRVGKLTAQVIKTTGHAAKVTAKQVGDLATAISNKTGIDDEAIQSGENMLLTFTSIRNEVGKGNKIFNQATQTVVDMSAALGQDMKSSAIQLGKALNDPIKGVSALQRVGVSFTESQKKQIKTLVDSGKTLDAQKVILRELGREFGGAAAAAASPMDKLRVSLGNVGEDIGTLLLPLVDKLATFLNTKAVPALNDFIAGIQDGHGAGGKFADAMKDVGDGLEKAWHVGEPFLKFIGKHPKLFTEIALGAGAFGAALKVVGAVRKLPGLSRLASKAAPLPVFVTNAGFGGATAGRGGPGGPIVGGGAKGLTAGTLLIGAIANRSVSKSKFSKFASDPDTLRRLGLKVTPSVDNHGLIRGIREAAERLHVLGATKPKPKPELDASGLMKGVRDASAHLQQLDAKHPRPKVDLDSSDAERRAAHLVQRIGEIKGKTIDLHANLITSGKSIKIADVHAAGNTLYIQGRGGKLALAKGGWVLGPGTGTSDSVPMYGSQGEFMVRQKVASKYPRQIEALNAGVPFERVAATAGGHTITFGDIIVADNHTALSVPDQMRQSLFVKGL